jgi:IS30 family transposase
MKQKPKLTLAEREQMFGWLHAGKSLREIARLLSRNHSSIVREVQRNRNQNTGEYLPCVAQGKADKREKLQREKAPLKEPFILLYVKHKLRMGWSPETIAGRLSLDHPGKHIDDETIYRYIYNARKHPKERLFEHLTLHRKKRMKHYGRKVRKAHIPGRTGIEMRPAEALMRTEFGHGETDLMEGVRSDKPVVHVTVERKTRYAQLQLLAHKTAQEKSQAVMLDSQEVAFKTMTADNGRENTDHQNWTVPTYFTTPYHSWEKGTVENTIGRLRRYIPKKISIAQLTQEELAFIQYEMNNTPRKCLNFLTPAESLALELQHVQTTKWCFSTANVGQQRIIAYKSCIFNL